MRQDFARHFDDFTLTLTRAQVLKHLRLNRSAHIDTFEKAKMGYFQLADAALRRKADDINRGELVRLTFDLTLPVCYVEQYDQLIRTFDLAKEEEFELSYAQYRCIVDDAWSWTDNFNITNSAYIVS